MDAPIYLSFRENGTIFHNIYFRKDALEKPLSSNYIQSRN